MSGRVASTKYITKNGGELLTFGSRMLGNNIKYATIRENGAYEVVVILGPLTNEYFSH